MDVPPTKRAPWRLMFWSCGAIILVLALLPPAPYLPSTGWDKSNHIVAFLVLTMLGFRAYPRLIGAVLAGAIIYGGLIEVLQSFTTYRSAEWADLFADGIGALIARGLLACRWPKWRHKNWR